MNNNIYGYTGKKLFYKIIIKIVGHPRLRHRKICVFLYIALMSRERGHGWREIIKVFL